MPWIRKHAARYAKEAIECDDNDDDGDDDGGDGAIASVSAAADIITNDGKAC